MGKKKNKQVLRPWCWYCEREFEDEKVLMQHQKAKHFKCGMCPRRLNTAGGLAVHIQQVHKLEPDNLPRIENALPGRDGYEVEIFGMEGIPAPDVADYKRRKEIELGLAAGSISQPQAKRPKIENRPMSEEELKAQLEAHKALMGLNNPEPSTTSTPETPSGAVVYGAPSQTYAAPPVPMPPPHGVTPPVPFPAGASPPPGMPGQPPHFPPFAPGMPPGPPPPGFPFPPGFPPGAPMPFPPGVRPPFPPFFPPGATPPPGFPPPGFTPPPGVPGASPPPPPNFVPATLQTTSPSTISPPPFGGTAIPGANTPPGPAPSSNPATQSQGQSKPPTLTLPNPALAQTLPEFKKPTELKWSDPNFSPEEHRAIHSKYYFVKTTDPAPVTTSANADEPRGKKRARAEDFL
ncbi:hypothetical protein AGABI1DRAFT_110572 [Agaricus bisporus var. burnettii JB137-S8]|uniref:C2H2-type domain-containing protein n=1 Tax=Agaricus bisporus var. burnettii (strain JB137-S8 / ATCC MYA-4627 / FGSC 10392) TaxID=597362 RepID=K5Y6Y5_AGABU|nr:uncharacterized protein AGABI1DRAFT_110572 [Agaricus bisporus var. burnettii JB137-S8]EKM83970.1 hypothetical protein AGABI1DRAFT_110572 [Agaricus bisporus var. burnettii JB137-S8]